MSKVNRYRAALVHAGLEIALALNGLQTPVDIEWTQRHVREALDVINAALEEA